MDSTLAVQQYIQQLIRKDPSAIDDILTPPDSQDEGVWKYEHLRSECYLLLLTWYFSIVLGLKLGCQR